MGAGEIDFSNRGDVDGVASENGSVTLKWDNPAGPGVGVELQQAEEASFAHAATRYRGSDSGSVVTGLPEGSHFFRVRENDGKWSSPLEVKVEFFPRPKLFLLLGIGGVVVVSTIGTIVLGAIKTRREERRV